MRIGEGARSAKRTLGGGEEAHGALKQRLRKREQWAPSTEVKIHLSLPRIYRSTELRSPNHTLCVH
jgi:hypothetical protein